METVAGIPFMRHTFLPSGVNLRLTISVSSFSIPSFSSSFFTLSPTFWNSAHTDALSAPLRISSREVRSPKIALRESITIDLPAPVSPVITLNPFSKSIDALLITAIFSICKFESIFSVSVQHCFYL